MIPKNLSWMRPWHKHNQGQVNLLPDKKNVCLIFRTNILEVETQLMTPLPPPINQNYFQQVQSLQHSRFLSFISFIVLIQTFICSYILWKKVISYLMLKEFNSLMLLCHLFSYFLLFFFSFSPFTDINNSGEIDKKDFEIAIQVSKKASTVVTNGNILQSRKR